MNLELRLAWRNIGRNLRRTGLTVAATVFAVFLVILSVATQHGVHEKMVEDAVRVLGGHVQVSGRDYLEEKTLEQYIELTPELLATLDATPGVVGAAPRVVGFGLVSKGSATNGVAVFGVDPEREGRVSTLPRRVVQGRFLEPGERGGLWLGERLARNLDAELGDELLLYSVAYSLETAYELYTVQGILRLPEPSLDRTLALISLEDARAFFAYGEKVSEVAVLAEQAGDVPPIVAALGSDLTGGDGAPLEVHAWDEVMPELAQFIVIDDAGAYMVLAILVVVVAFGILNTIPHVGARTRPRAWRHVGPGPEAPVRLPGRLLRVAHARRRGPRDRPRPRDPDRPVARAEPDPAGRGDVPGHGADRHGPGHRVRPASHHADRGLDRDPRGGGPRRALPRHQGQPRPPRRRAAESLMGEVLRSLFSGSTWRMAWRNVGRNKRRTAVIGSAIAIGVGATVLAMAINYGMIFGMVRVAIDTELGHVQIHAPGFEEKPALEKSIGPADVERADFEALDGLEAWAPRVRHEGLVSSPRAAVGVRVLGIDPTREAQVTELPGSLTEGRFLGEERRRVVMGERLAKRLKVGPGDRVVVSAQDLGGDLTGEAFRVAGLFRTASREFDESAVVLELGEAQQMLGLGEAISELVIRTEEGAEPDVVARELSGRLGDEGEVRTWEEMRPTLVAMVAMFDQVGWVLYAAVFIAMAFGIANVLLMSLYERIREIGILMAIGMQPGRMVAALVVVESLVLTGIGTWRSASRSGFGLASRLLSGTGIDLSRWGEGLDGVRHSDAASCPSCCRRRTSDHAGRHRHSSPRSCASLWPAILRAVRIASRRGRAPCLSGGAMLEAREAIHKIYDTRGVETIAP